MGKRSDKTNTGEGGKGKKGRTGHQQEFPDLTRMVRQYLTVPDTSASPERFFSRVGLVQTDLCGSLLDTTMIDLMWAKQAP